MTLFTNKAKDRRMHHKSPQYRDAGKRKLDTYHRFIQVESIAKGFMRVLATTVPKLVLSTSTSYFRIIRQGITLCDAMVAISLQNTFPTLIGGQLYRINPHKILALKTQFTKE